VQIVFPGRTNWFARFLAERVAAALSAQGGAAELLAADEVEPGELESRVASGITAFLWFQETRLSLERLRRRAQFDAAAQGAAWPVLLSADCLQAPWFRDNLEVGVGFRAIVDIGVRPQAPPQGLGLPMLFLPEAFTASERSRVYHEIRSRTPRPIPWCTVGFMTEERSRLLAETLQVFGPEGVAFLPRHRPYRAATWSLDREGLERLYRRSEVTIWTSHHPHAYVEPLRALLAVRCGCVPIKIEPRWHAQLAAVPWVHASLASARAALDSLGPRRMLERCHAYIDRVGSLESAAGEVFTALAARRQGRRSRS
jgi:hypothetical protein